MKHLQLTFKGDTKKARFFTKSTRKLFKHGCKKNKYKGKLEFKMVDIDDGRILEVYVDEEQYEGAILGLVGMKDHMKKVGLEFKAEVVNDRRI